MKKNERNNWKTYCLGLFEKEERKNTYSSGVAYVYFHSFIHLIQYVLCQVQQCISVVLCCVDSDRMLIVRKHIRPASQSVSLFVQAKTWIKCASNTRIHILCFVLLLNFSLFAVWCFILCIGQVVLVAAFWSLVWLLPDY